MQYLGAIVDVFHAILMMVWLLGLPLLFWHRYPRLSLVYIIYSLLFVIINLLSQHFLGECIFTTLSRYCWSFATTDIDSNEWFSVRFARFIFGLTPSHRAIKNITEILIAISALGGLYFLFLRRRNICQNFH